MPSLNENRIWAGRKIGVEMEFKKKRRVNRSGRETYRPLRAEAIVEALNSARVSRVTGNGNYYQSRHSGSAWEVKYDMTAGWEVCTPALVLDEDGHNDELRRGCEAIYNLRPVINRSCGMHVHVEAQDLDWKGIQKLLALWARYEPWFYGMVPDSRVGNNYCQALRGTDWRAAGRSDDSVDSAYGARGNRNLLEQALAASTERDFRRYTQQMPRYCALRVEHWWRTGRVEFRLHSGTVTYEKIRNFAVICATLVGRVATAGRVTPRLSTKVYQPGVEDGFRTNYVLRMIGMGPGNWNDWDEPTEVYEEIRAYVERRRRKFGRV